MKEYGLFTDLRWMIPKTKAQEARKKTWILADIWRLVDTRVSMRQDITCNQGLLQRPSRQIAASLKADQQRRVDTDRGKIEDILTSDPTLNNEVCHKMKG